MVVGGSGMEATTAMPCNDQNEFEKKINVACVAAIVVVVAVADANNLTAEKQNKLKSYLLLLYLGGGTLRMNIY